MAAYELTKTILKDNTNLKAYYRMEAGALTTDSSGNSKTLTNNNTVADGTGVYGGGADFSASNTNKSLRISDDLGINATNAMSISVWVKLNAEIGSGTWCFVDKLFAGASGTTMQILYEYNAGTRRIVFRRLGTANAYIYYTLTMGTSSWYHFVFTWDGTNIRGFVNSTHVGVTASSGTFNLGAYATNVSIGATNATDNTQFSSIIADDCAFFSTALSADQIKELYEGRYIGEWWPQANLSAIYHLNGSSTDTSGNNYHGTDTAITYSQANGKYVQGAGFNGSSSYIQCPAKILSVGAKTIMFWLKTSTVANQVVIASGIWDATSNGTSVYINATTGYLTFQERQTVASPILSISTPASVCDGAWKHIVCVWDGTTNANTGIIYVNGASVVTGTATATQSSQDNNTKIGRREGATPYYFTGNLDEILSFSRALTAAEIRKYYAWSMGRYI